MTNSGIKTKLKEYDKLDFSECQLDEIRQGLKDGVDVSKYANKDISWEEMHEIRKGLKAGVDMSEYAGRGFDISQLSVIREGLEAGLDVAAYANPNYSWIEMTKSYLKLKTEQNEFSKTEQDEVELEYDENIDESFCVRTEAKTRIKQSELSR